MKLKVASFFLVSGLIASVYAQPNPVALQYSDLIDTVSAYKHLSTLSSDAFEGRETGKPGAAKAANYLSEEFKKLGLNAPVNNSYFQKVDLVEKFLKANKFSVNGTSVNYLEDFYIRGFSGSKNINTKEIIFLGYGISSPNYDDLKGINVAGKVVILFSQGEPVKQGISAITKTTTVSEWSRAINKRVDELKAKKPALILLINSGLSASLKSGKLHIGKPSVSIQEKDINTSKADVPVIVVTTETADLFLKLTGKSAQQLKDKIDKEGKPASQKVKVNFRANFASVIQPIEAVNVLGYLEGTDLKDELVVVSAHYDHIGLNTHGTDKVFNGADDDGSGTTAVLELAEAFAKARKEGKGPRRSILFLLVVGEEKGLLGSEWYSEHPVFPLRNTITDLNIDMIGRIDPAHKEEPNYCYLIGSDKLSTDLHKISENANATYTNFKLDYKYNDPNDPERIYYRSDHYNFAKHNIPIIFYFNGVHEDYHQPSDEISKINFPLLVKRAQLVFFTAWDLVNRDMRPVVDVKND